MTGSSPLDSRARWRALSISARALALALVLARAAVAAPYVAAACSGVQPDDIAFEVRAEPAEVAIGEAVDVQVRIVPFAADRAAIPLFRLLGAEPAFAVEAQDSSYPALAYAHYRLRALQAGDAAVRIAVNFATVSGCGDAASLVFRSAYSQLVTVRVREVADGDARTVTPTRTVRADATPRQRIGRR